MNEAGANVPYLHSYWVAPESFLAGEHPMDSDEESSRSRLSALLDSGIRTFLDLTEPGELPEYRQLLLELAGERGLKVTPIRMPLRDRSVPPDEVLKQILDVIDHSLAERTPLFVHCFAGIGRTGTVVGCHLMRHGLATSETVIEKIRNLRRFFAGDFDLSPHTPEQVEKVKTWRKGD